MEMQCYKLTSYDHVNQVMHRMLLYFQINTAPDINSTCPNNSIVQSKADSRHDLHCNARVVAENKRTCMYVSRFEFI